MYHFTRNGFEQDPDWNGGHVYIFDRSIQGDDFKKEKAQVIKAGFDVNR